MKNIFYFNHINSIGGIESFFYQLAKIYSEDNDITIFYKTADSKQLARLKKLVRCVKWRGEEIECEKAFFNFNLDAINKVKAKEYIQILHGDYKAMGIKPNMHPKINKYISVSETVQKSFKEITGIDSELIYNPIEVEEPKKVLFLISATRLTYEKGKERIIKLASKLDNDNIPYLWLIFTDNTNEIVNPNVIYMKPRLDIIDYIKKADYLVQLSDAEGYCYSVVEALSVGTPVIVTDMPVMSEIGVNTDNGFILDFNLSNVDTKAIYEKEFNFKYEPPKSEWQKELIKSKSKYKEELKMRFKVEALPIWKERNITCTDLNNKTPNEGDQWEVDKERLDVLLGDNPFNQPFVKLVEEIKEETNKDKPFVGDIKEHNEKALEEYKQAIKEYENSIENKIEDCIDKITDKYYNISRFVKKSNKEDKPKVTTKKKAIKKKQTKSKQKTKIN